MAKTFKPKPVSTGKGVKYAVEVRVYGDGHGNLIIGGENYPVDSFEQAVGYLGNLWRQGR